VIPQAALQTQKGAADGLVKRLNAEADLVQRTKDRLYTRNLFFSG